MDIEVQALSTVLFDKRRENSQSIEVGEIKNKFVNFKLWKIRTININFFNRQEKTIRRYQNPALPLRRT